MIEGIRVQYVHVLQDFMMGLAQFTIIVGPNACGKTTLLRSLSGQTPGKVWAEEFRDDLTPGPVVQCVSRLQADRPSMRFLQFEPTALRKGATAAGAAGMDEKGYGLGRVLAELILRSSSARELAAARLGAIVPGVRDVGVHNRGGEFFPVVTFDDLGVVPTDGLSEGTLYALGLVVSLDWTQGPKLLLIDDLDKGLHPAAQAEIVNVLRKVQAEDPNLQIVATTHSPYLLQEFDHSEVRVMTRGPDGFARCRNLVDHPEYEAWKDALNAGAYWSAVGEDWIVAPSA